MIRFPLFPSLLSTVVPLAISLFGGVEARAQEDSGVDRHYVGAETLPAHLEFGIDPAAILTLPLGSPTSIRGTQPCSEQFAGMSRVNPSIGLFGTYVLPNRADGIGSGLRAIRLGVGLDDVSSEFRATPLTTQAFDESSGRYVGTETQYIAEFDLRYLRAATELEYSLGGDLALRGGPSLMIPLSGSSIEQEHIVAPSNLTFLDNTQERTIPGTEGALSDLGVRVGIGAGLRYRLPLGRRTFFDAGVAADLAITSIQPGWSPLVLRTGIALGYRLLPLKQPPPPVVVEPPPPSGPEPFSADFQIRVVADALPIELRRQVVARYVPIIPVVFFDLNSAEIPARYSLLQSSENTDSFTEQALPAQADEVHHSVLDIIGSRMVRHSRARVTIVGTTSQDENDRLVLAQARADRIKSYLTQVWGIDSRRIRTQSRLAPLVASNPTYDEGRAENRRVEFEFSTEELYSPVQLRTVEPVERPEQIDFNVAVEASHPVSTWEFELQSNGRAVERLSGTGTPPSSLTWRLTQDDREIALSQGAVTYQLSVSDQLGRRERSSAERIPLRLDTTVSVRTSANLPANAAEFLLVTFDYNRAELTARGRRELQAILERIGPRSRVEVIGYTDQLGDEQRNRELAAERARLVASLLPSSIQVTARGALPNEAPYPGALPEGRFLSRTVRVLIADPR